MWRTLARDAGLMVAISLLWAPLRPCLAHGATHPMASPLGSMTAAGAENGEPAGTADAERWPLPSRFGLAVQASLGPRFTLADTPPRGP